MIGELSNGILGICMVIAVAIAKYGPPIVRSNVTDKRCGENREALKELLENKIDNLSDTVSGLKVTVEKNAELTHSSMTALQTTMTEVLKAVKVN